jgi:ribonuclease P protein component
MPPPPSTRPQHHPQMWKSGGGDRLSICGFGRFVWLGEVSKEPALRRPRSGGRAHRTIGPPARHKGVTDSFLPSYTGSGCPSQGIRLPSPSGRHWDEMSGRREADEAHLSTEQSQASQEARVPAPHVDARRTGDRPRPAAEGPSPPHRLKPRIWRVRDRATFVALRRSDCRVHDGPITVTWAPGDPAEPPRVAYAIGRRVGGATLRNRVRRRLRSIVRDLRPALGPGAWLIGAAPEVANLSYAELKAAVARAVAALGPESGRR